MFRQRSVAAAACAKRPVPLDSSRVVARISRLLALFIAFVLMPGALELVENAGHLVSDGHTTHSVDDAEHAPKGDEHGCSGAFHACKCHSSASFLVSDAGFTAAPVPMPLDSRLMAGAAGHPSDGHPLGVYRPPSA